MNKVEEIISIYQNYQTEYLKIAIIQNGTQSTERKIVESLGITCKLVQHHQISSPTIIVTGKVVKKISKINTFFQKDFLNDVFVFQNLDYKIHN